MSDCDRKHENKLFIDGKEYETPQTALTGAEIKALASIPASYQLFLEERGDTPDKPISDSQSERLDGEIKHFYAVPPATFG